jgi:hypothetical protein
VTTVSRTCACGKVFQARQADVDRGWAKSCSKSCAASRREKKTGNYARFCGLRNAAINAERDPEFSDAHLFSNEEHDCNKD